MGFFDKVKSEVGGVADRAVSQTFGGDDPWAKARNTAAGAAMGMGVGGMIPGIGGGLGAAGGGLMGKDKAVGGDGGGGSANPYGIMGPTRPAEAFTIDPNQISQLNLEGQSMDPYRQQALADIDTQAASGLAGAETKLAQTGGLSAADRAALASEFNRNKIMARGGALGKYAGMEAQSAADAAKANQMFNAQALNQNLYANQAARQQAQQLTREDEMLRRQLAASGQIADAQARAADKPGGLLGGSLIPGVL